MKKLQPYLPFIMLAIAAIAAVYFFYYKPKKDKAALDQAAAQAAADSELTAYKNPLANVKISTQALSAKAQSISAIL